MIDVTDLSMDSIQVLLDNAGEHDATTALVACSDKSTVVGKVVQETEKALQIEGDWFLPRRGNWTGQIINHRHWVPKSQVAESALTDQETVFILKNWIAHKISNEFKNSI